MANYEDNSQTQNTSDLEHQDSATVGNVDPAKSDHESYTRDYKISHPVDDVSELHASAFQQAKLRAANTTTGFAPGDRRDPDEQRIEREFDRNVLAIARRVLAAPELGLDSNDLPVEEKFVLAFVLQVVRAEPLEAFKTHLKQVEQIRADLGINAWELENNRFENQWDELEPVRETLTEAATRTRYAAYRIGHRFPTAVWDATVATDDTALLTGAEKTDIEQGKIPSNDEHTALQNWAEAFLEACVRDVVSFGRDPDRTTYPPVAFVGVFAHAALQSQHLNQAPKTCAHWVADPDVVPAGRTIRETITDLSVTDIETLGQDMNQAFFAFANQYDVFAGSQKLAFDPTMITEDVDPDENPWMEGHAKIPRGNDSTSDDADARWTFGVAGVIEPDLHFILGTYPQGRDVKSAHSLTRIFRPIQQDTQVTGRVIMDRGLVGAELVTHCRDVVGDKWLLHGKNEHDLGQLIDDTPEGETAFYDLAARDNDYEYLKDLTPMPNAIVVPIPDEESADTTASHRVYLTDLPKERFSTDAASTADDHSSAHDDGEIDQTLVNSMYRKRRRIETSIQQLKYGFNISFNTTASDELKYCTFYFSALFYNLHNLINNSLSPTHGLPLGEHDHTYVTIGQVLSAIRDAAFEMAADTQ